MNMSRIGVLTVLEAIRKRPGMFFNPVEVNPSNDWRKDPLFPAKLVRQCLMFAVGATKAHITVGPEGRAKVNFDVATDPRLFVASPGPGPPMVFGEEDIVCGDLAAVVACCEVFEAIILFDDNAEYGQRWEKGVEAHTTELAARSHEIIGNADGPATFIEIQLDAEYLPTVEIDTHFLMQGTNNLPFPVTLVF